MPKQVIKDTLWSERIESADKYYKQWEGRFKCDILEKYYEGLQWRAQREIGYDPYVINKFYELIQLKISKYVPSFPSFILSPKPSAAEWDFEDAAKATQLKEDLLNTLIDDDRKHFTEEAEHAYKDHFFRFGMIEVGYSADWIYNPNAPKPFLKKDTDKQVTGDEGRRKVTPSDQPEELPLNERIYFKHIPAKRFRVGGLDHKYLDRCGWCGYYEYIDKNDLLSLKIMNRDKVENAVGVDINAESEVPEDSDRNTPRITANVVKIWRVWDSKSRLQLIVLDSPKVTLFQRKFKRLPLIDLRPDRRIITNGFYPVPPSYHWLSPQDEINETREQLRAHRRRFIRKFQIKEGMMDDAEIEKFETGPDGAVVKNKDGVGIQPVQDANLGSSISESIPLSSDDLNRLSGSTSEEQGVADRTTATQAKIVDTRSSVRGTKDQDRVVTWFSRMGREALLIAREKFTLGTWIELTSPEGSAFAQTFKQAQSTYKWVSAEELQDDYDFRVDVDLTSISQSIQDMEKQRMIEFLSILTQFPMVAFSPILIREIAYRVGYRNERILQEYQQMALLMELSRMQQLKAQLQPPPQQQQPGQMGAPPPNGNAPQQQVAAMNPPGAEQIRQQLQNQMVPQTQ